MTPDATAIIHPACWACAPMYAEWQAVFVAIILGVEAAAYVALVGATAMLCLRGFVAVIRRVWA